MATASFDSYREGIQNGVARATRRGLLPRSDAGVTALASGQYREFALSRLGRTLDAPTTMAAAQFRQSDVSDRFTELFMELITVATIARSVYGDAPLEASDIDRYLTMSMSILNSFRHA